MHVSEALTCPSCGVVCDLEHKYCPGCGFPIEKLRNKADDPMIGTTLPGGHVVIELIDVGGMGRVYRAEQKMLGRTVAVKIIHPHLLGDPTVEARFITEARAASQLNHPNSVGVIDFGKHDDRLYMVMEYLRGRDLATVAHEDGPLEIERITDIMVQILAALEEAHHIGIVHRDLKPENIVLSPLRSGGDFVKVLDFGLAKVLEASKTLSAKRITDPGMVCGTPEYMAPEQARGDNVDHRVDLYACGVLLYELLAGQLPFDGDSPRQIVLMHLSKPPPDIYTVAPEREIPEDLLEVVYRALAKSADERYQNAQEFTEAIKEAMIEDRSLPYIQLDQQMKKCRSCGAMMPRAQKFCGECGKPLSKHQPSLRPSAQPVESNRPKTGLPLPLVGRERELGWLLDRHDKLNGGSLTGAAIVGMPGMGKTRLLEAFIEDVREQGDLVVNVGPDPWASSMGYYALRSAIAQLADIDEAGDPTQWQGVTPEARAGLEAVFDLRDKNKPRQRWADTPPDPVPNATRVLAADALRWAFGRAQSRAKQGRVVLTVDDLPAVDGASRNAFSDVVGEPPLVNAFMISSHTPDFKLDWDGADALRLEGLPIDVAGSVLSGGELPKALTSDRDSRVAPMYLEQLVRYMREGGEDPPSKLADLIALRIERLDADTRRVLQAIAVLGEEAQATQLVAMLPEMSEIGRFMTVLRQAGFIDIDATSAGCSHPLLRDIVLSTIPHGVRGELHAAAQRDSDSVTVPLEARAVHAYYGANSFEALMLLELSAEKARDRDDPDGAVRAFHLALELSRREMMLGNLEDPISAVLLFSCKLGDALTLAGKYSDADGVLAEALNLAGPQAKERPRILASLANVARGEGRAGDAYAHLEEALTIAEKARQTELVDSLEQMRSRWVAGV